MREHGNSSYYPPLDRSLAVRLSDLLTGAGFGLAVDDEYALNRAQESTGSFSHWMPCVIDGLPVLTEKKHEDVAVMGEFEGLSTLSS
ncbi:hypothetical protein ACWEFL_16995 [Streptomyces sp. NPDC004838]